uniref:MD-2-related lipid-recognition domain-containing protein n=1 Tax=Musca domestica TaxID=7370 RepID=A0A1I8MEZ2_MUSDO
MKYIVAGLIFAVSLEPITARFMNFTAINATFNEKYMSGIRSWIDQGLVNIEMTTVQTLNYGMRASTSIQMKLENSRKYQTLFAYDIDICKLLGGMKDSILRNWFRNILKYSNLMENCPVVPDKYVIRNMRLESNNIPPFLRPGDYRFTVMNYFGKKKTKTFDMVCRLNVEMKIF